MKARMLPGPRVAPSVVKITTNTKARKADTKADTSKGIFVEFQHERWYSTGRPQPLDPASLKRVGELNGFPVFTTRDSNGATIYIPIAKDADAYAAYSKRKAK